ncbi:MAG: hypothetical protein VXX36_01440 [Verrucomicrobiota bacterium]|nr:hypothetical protein [Verrucomicrobiota bacterium]
MKSLFSIATAILLINSAALADSTPVITAAQAAQIAQQDLESRGIEGQFYIWQMTYKKDSFMSGKRYWEVLWNKSFPAQTEGRKEFGLRIQMNGEYTRAVK